jgi:hypothetical protein
MREEEKREKTESEGVQKKEVSFDRRQSPVCYPCLPLIFFLQTLCGFLKAEDLRIEYNPLIL